MPSPSACPPDQTTADDSRCVECLLVLADLTRQRDFDQAVIPFEQNVPHPFSLLGRVEDIEPSPSDPAEDEPEEKPDERAEYASCPPPARRSVREEGERAQEKGDGQRKSKVPHIGGRAYPRRVPVARAAGISF